MKQLGVVLFSFSIFYIGCLSFDKNESRNGEGEITTKINLIDKDVLNNLIDSSEKPYQYVIIFRGLCGGNKSMLSMLDSIPIAYKDSINFIFCNCDLYSDCDEMSSLLESSKLKDQKIYFINNDKFLAKNEFVRAALFAKSISNVWKGDTNKGVGVPYPIILSKNKNTILFREYIKSNFANFLSNYRKGATSFWDTETNQYSSIDYN